MVKGILARKIGMTQVFAADGAMVPVTVVQAGPCVVVVRRTSERDGYEALDRRGLQAQWGFVGVDHAEAGQAAEVVEGPGQRLGRQIEIKQSTGLLRSGLGGHGDRQRR